MALIWPQEKVLLILALMRAGYCERDMMEKLDSAISGEARALTDVGIVRYKKSGSTRLSVVNKR